MSKNDREILLKVNKDFVQNRTDLRDSRKLSEVFGEDLDVNLLAPEVQKEAVLRLKFGRMVQGDDDGLDSQHLLGDFVEYFEKGNDEFFYAQNGLVFGFIKKQTFEDSFNMELDWKVRYYALEEIYLELSKLPTLTNEQQWSLNKFIYVQLNRGVRMEFLDTHKRSNGYLLSEENHKDGYAAVGAGHPAERPGAGHQVSAAFQPVQPADDRPLLREERPLLAQSGQDQHHLAVHGAEGRVVQVLHGAGADHAAALRRHSACAQNRVRRALPCAASLQK